MFKKKTSLIISFCLLGSALLLLSGCSWDNEPAATSKPDNALPLDKLNSDNTPPSTQPKQPASTQPTPPPQPTPPMTNQKQYPNLPAMSLDADKTYTATLNTGKGEIVIALHAKANPITTNNFVFLARDHFYDGTVFHRTIPGFMIQGGDPQGTGMGGPGYHFDDEPFAGEYTRGVVAMANAGPNTNGSQFFIMQADKPLPKNYVIFGEVTSGMEVVDAIATAPATMGADGAQSKPVTPITIQSVTIEEK